MKGPVEIDNNFISGVGVLTCPVCSEFYLHHSDVLVYDRQGEDGPVIRTVVSNGSASVSLLPDSNNENPSSRRDGIRIPFYCEHCDDKVKLHLCIAQHKGNTHIRWDLVFTLAGK